MAKLKVLVNGAKGKMGAETVKAVKKESDLELVGQTDIGDSLARTIKETKAEIVVDFTQPSAAMTNVKTILNNNAHAVVGTTGLTDKDLSKINDLCVKNRVNCIVAPNFAIGAVLMMKFSQEAVKYMPNAEIIELHHDQKKDAPSGTAIKTAQLMGKDVPIHSVRLPGLVAHQEVIFGGLGQTLTIRHDSLSRESFMPGVIMAIRQVKKQKGLVYGLEKIL